MSKFYKINKFKNSAGFTLLELLLAMGILAFLLVSAITFFTNFNQRQSINIAYDNLNTALAQAKSYSLSQVAFQCKEEELVSRELNGFKIAFDVDNGGYEIIESCIVSDVEEDLEPSVKTYQLPEGITFASASPFIEFRILSGGSSGGFVEITDGERVKRIEVNTNGVISDASP